MSHLEYIYILNRDLTKFYKDPHPVGDFSIAPQLKLRHADRQRGHIVMVKTYIFHRRFSPSIGQPPLTLKHDLEKVQGSLGCIKSRGDTSPAYCTHTLQGATAEG